MFKRILRVIGSFDPCTLHVNQTPLSHLERQSYRNNSYVNRL